MYVKFFSNRKGGSSASIKYLLNNREKEGTAKTIKGDPYLTKKIIDSIERKQKATVGVLSFEEKNPLTKKQKLEVIEAFEKTLLPGLDQDQYNILWVEHTDKGRLELNFVIPKVELTSGKALQPYYHKADFARIDMFEDLTNIRFNLSSKKDPAKQRTLQGSHKEVKLVKDYKELDNTLLQLVGDGNIANREQLIELLKDNKIQVSRVGKDYISVKLPDSKKAKRLKGGIYSEQFTGVAELEKISEETERRAREFRERDTSREYEAIRKRFVGYVEQKARQNREKYKKGRVGGDKRDDIRANRLETDSSDIRSRNDNWRSNSRNNQVRGDNDSIRTATNRAKRRAYQEAREARIKLYEANTAKPRDVREQIDRDYGALYRQAKESVRTKRQRRANRRRNLAGIKQIVGKAGELRAEVDRRWQDNIQKSSDTIRKIERFERKIERFLENREETFDELLDKLRESQKGMGYEEDKELDNKSFDELMAELKGDKKPSYDDDYSEGMGMGM